MLTSWTTTAFSITSEDRYLTVSPKQTRQKKIARLANPENARGEIGGEYPEHGTTLACVAPAANVKPACTQMHAQMPCPPAQMPPTLSHSRQRRFGSVVQRAWQPLTGQWCLVPAPDAVHDPQHWALKSAGRGGRLGVGGDDWADASTTHPSPGCQRSQSHVFVTAVTKAAGGHRGG
jgi:hypothetical protein